VSEKPRLLMCVYNALEYDGRVQRCASALAARYSVRVVDVRSEHPYADPAYEVCSLALPSRAGKSLPHLVFLRGLLRAAREFRPHVVHAHDFFMGWPGWAAARAADARLVYDAHELIVPEPGIPQTARDRFWYRSERWAVRRADLVIAANRPRGEVMREHYGLARTPVVVGNVPPAPRPGRPAAEVLARYPALARATTPGAVRLVYQGDVDVQRGLDRMLGALERLPERFELVMAGGGPDLKWLRHAAEPFGRRVTVLGQVPREDLHAIMGACDIGLISYSERGLNNILCAPNKLYEYAHAGLPMVARDNPVLNEAFERWGVGVSGADLAESVLRVSESIDEYRRRLGPFLRGSTWEVEAARLLDAYAELGLEGGEPRRPLARAPVRARAARERHPGALK
jgi:glycosyltransferase involved in cell wall biosynthesis